jgi:hypothetical protein
VKLNYYLNQYQCVSGIYIGERWYVDRYEPR